MRYLIIISLVIFSTQLMAQETTTPQNVLGTPLESCCNDPMTGYWRDGYCRTASEDRGTHVVCAIMTTAFLIAPAIAF